MTQSPAALRRRGGKGLHKKTANSLHNPGTKGKPKKLREYLEPAEVDALIEAAPNVTARLCMMLQWRAGLRVSEAINVTGTDVRLKTKPPELKVRQGKGHKDRIVPLHPDLAGNLENAIAMWKQPKGNPLIGTSRQRAWQWYQSGAQSLLRRRDHPRG